MTIKNNWERSYHYFTKYLMKRASNLFLLLAGFFLVNPAASQETKSFVLDWSSPVEYGLEGSNFSFKTLYFEGAELNTNDLNSLPYFYKEIESNGSNVLASATISNAVYERISGEERQILKNQIIPEEIEIEIINSIISKQNVNFLKFIPLRNNQGSIEKLKSFDLILRFEKTKLRRNKSMTFVSESKLNQGEWYKIGVTEQALYKLDYNFLNNLGIDLDQVDPRNIRLYGYGGGMLPELNSESRPDDLIENAISVVGEEDGRFDVDDYLIFYGEDQSAWFYDETREVFRYTLNRYSDTAFYFINVAEGAGKRIVKMSPPAESPTMVVSEYDDFEHYEKNDISLLKSGQVWLGEIFDNTLRYDFSFDFEDVVESDTASIEVSVAARSGVPSSFRTVIGQEAFTTSVGIVNLNRYESTFAQFSRDFFSFQPNEGAQVVSLTYDKPQSTSRGWLNSLTVNVRKKLNDRRGQVFFRDIESVGENNIVEFEITSSDRDIKVYELTDKYNVKELSIIDNGNTKSFISATDELKEFVAFTELNSFGVYPKGRVKNQNLHGHPQADLIIVTNPLFLNQANQLANLHRGEGLAVNVATTEQIYNEFSSGSQDLIAIRSYIKMFYDRSVNDDDRVKYALFIGDASYDYKDKINGNTNFVPAFQSVNSTSPTESYVSDDYFGFLDDTEGKWSIGGSDRLDIGIGRLPVKTVAESEGMVNKLINYYSSNTLKEWRNDVVFVGDDEDGRIHMSQSNNLSKILNQEDKTFNQKKIFLDAYAQQSTSSGDRYPQANEELNTAVRNGALIVNYTGHGGETGWSAERVLGISDIIAWDNINSLPLFLTATCEFSRFDDPLRTSGGELLILNPNGGGVGLYTTTRLVYSRPNYFLNATFYERAFEKTDDGRFKRLGDIFMEVKNTHASSSNSRNFTFLGDPAINFAIPKHQVITAEVNGKPISSMDTLSALSRVTVKGYLADENSTKLEEFNGTVDITVFDKIEDKRTLNNDGNGVFEFEERSNRLFKGKATVTNGDFEFSFVVPKDISYSFGRGKISYYATDNREDGNGYTEQFIVGGSDSNAVQDNEGPDIDLFMNDESFVYGGITDNNPLLIAELSDEQGINTVGSGIGHDLVAILDENTQDAFILNDYYEAAIDDYSRGKISFPLSDLSEGKHTLRLKAWDVANNSSEKTIEFVVMEDKEIEIDNLVNYPNPFTTNTEFIFQHNQAGVPMDVKLEIFTVSGKLVRSFNEVVLNDGFISRDIKWNGRDDYGDKIGKGVYVYKMKVRSRNGSTTEKIEKLVIL